MKNTHQQISLDFLPSLVGIPYDQKDCWGVVREFLRLYKEIDIPEYFYFDPCDHNEICNLVKKQKHSYTKVLKPDTGDIILIRVFGAAAHLGIYLNNDKFLHTQKTTGSIIDSIQKWKPRILGYYRYDKN